MRILYLFTLLLFACSNSKVQTVQRDHGECLVTILHFDNELNDTSRIIFIKSVVFDTTASLIQGFVTDQEKKPVSKAEIFLFNRETKIYTSTNEAGEFKIFKDLFKPPYNIKVSAPGFVCMYVRDVIQTGGQWVEIKLMRE